MSFRCTFEPYGGSGRSNPPSAETTGVCSEPNTTEKTMNAIRRIKRLTVSYGTMRWLWSLTFGREHERIVRRRLAEIRSGEL